MSHGGGGEEGGDKNRWLVSYADFITLLFVLFVILWAMGKTDIAKYRALADSLSVAFSFGGGTANKMIDASINQTSGSDPDAVPDPISVPGIPKKQPASIDVAGKLTDLLSEYNLEGGVSVQTSIEGVLISLSEKLLFSPSTATLHEDAYPVLDSIIEMLNPIDNKIKIIGHTDNSPSSDPRYPTNWELSVGRAWVIADYLIKSGISPERIIISGQGEYAPIFPNDTDEHRILNSRADIVILYEVETSIIQGESPLSTLK